MAQVHNSITVLVYKPLSCSMGIWHKLCLGQVTFCYVDSIMEVFILSK